MSQFASNLSHNSVCQPAQTFILKFGPKHKWGNTTVSSAPQPMVNARQPTAKRSAPAGPAQPLNQQLKCQGASLALRGAMEEMPAKPWLDRCEDAIESINQTEGVEHVCIKEAVSQFGFQMQSSSEDLKQVNERRQGKCCSDRFAATKKRGASEQ
jgi:hypothetical protein